MHFHKWSKWEQYDYRYHKYIDGVIQRDSWWGEPIIYYELREKRYCKICNKMQDRKVWRG